MTTTQITPQPVPLVRGHDGAWIVGHSQIPLERILEAYGNGASPETIVQWFDTLQLADVYAVLSYCLNHSREVSEYLKERDALADAVRAEVEASQLARPGMRAALLARRRRADKSDASAPH